MASEDLYKRDDNLEKYAGRCISRLHPEDRGDVERFCNDLLAEGYSTSRVMKYVSALSSISRRLGKPFKDLTMEDVKAYVAGLERSSYSGWTKHDHKVILRRYMRWLGKGEAVDWIKVKQPKNGTTPEEVLTEEDIKKLAAVAYTTRDRALVLALYESGCRIGEFLPLRLRHVSFDRYGAVLRVSGKTGDRRVRLVASSLSLERWIEEHPRKDDPDAYLWCKTPTPNNPKWKNNHLSYGFTCRLLRELAVKAGVKKRVNPHAFRHARATFLARHLKEPEMREFFGWGRDSEMPSIYVHLSGRDVDGSLLAVYGYKEAKEAQDPVIRVMECPRCKEKTDPASLFCRKCGLPLGDRAGFDVDRFEELMIDFLKAVAEEFPSVRERFRRIVEEKGARELFT
jgi:site-specific recombinase XerD